MKLTNGEIFDAREPLAELLLKELPVKVSYGLATLSLKLDAQLQIINKVRMGLFKTYGEPDPVNPTKLLVRPGTEKAEKFFSEQTELMAQEVEIVLEPVGLPDTLEIKPLALLALRKFVKVK